MDTRIYLDHNATTPVDPRVLERMLPAFHRDFGNASSRSHAFGWRAQELVETAREEVAGAIGARPAEIVFTSGATEAINLAIRGVAEASTARGRHLVTSRAEHSAVLDCARHLEGRGWEVTWLDPSPTGRVPAESVAAALRDDTVLVALMWANNEVGAINPIAEVGALCRARGVTLFTDATQGVGKVPVDVAAAGVDLLSMTAHKLYGPKGAGALFVRSGEPRVRLVPQQLGGGQERGLRAGTLNVPGIVGLGAACRLAVEEMDTEGPRLARLRDRLEERITAELDGVHLNGDRAHRLPATLHLSFDGVEAEALMLAMPDVAVSSGAACSSGSAAPSHVLRAMGVPDTRAHGSIRFGLGRFTTEEEVDRAARLVVEGVRRLRGTSPATPASPDASSRVHS